MRLTFTRTPSHGLSQFIGVLLSLFLLTRATAWAAPVDTDALGLRNDEETFVFSGKCANDEPYRLVSYQRNVSGLSRSFYDYAGPNGQGTVQAETPPKVMAARVCRQWAEIINAHYWD